MPRVQFGLILSENSEILPDRTDRARHLSDVGRLLAYVDVTTTPPA